MQTPDRNSLLRELKNQLLFLKDAGYSEIPCESELLTDSMSPLNSSPIKIMADNTKTNSLIEVREELGDCTRCKLSQGRKNIVFGSGNPKADLVFVGEGPGADEDEQGLPFVGRAGKKLTEIIEKGMLLDREKDTYICNIVKCRPPGNRDPEKEEIVACNPFLIQQLKAIQPKVVGPLFILKGIDLFYSKFFEIGCGTSIDGGSRGDCSPVLGLMTSLTEPYKLLHCVS